MNTKQSKITYWHHELPPVDAEPLGEHVVEATSQHIPGTLSRTDDQWAPCYQDLMRAAEARIAQEVARLGGDYAHIISEHVDEQHNDAMHEAWLHGAFTYMLFKRKVE